MQGTVISFITTGFGLARIVTPLWGKQREKFKHVISDVCVCVCYGIISAYTDAL